MGVGRSPTETLMLTATAAPAIEAVGITVRAGGRALVDSVDLVVEPGEFVALVGPNGAGKSTLAAVLVGDLRPDAGEVRIEGRPIGEYRHRELARVRAVLPQQTRVDFPFPVAEVVLMGRHPHLGRGQGPGPSDRAAAAEAMAATEIEPLAARAFPTLSGGEQARASLARVLAQSASVLVLDEPMAALDLRHQRRVVDLCRRLAGEGRAVLVVVHELNQAAAADRVGVMDRGRLVACGAPADVLTADRIEAIFGVAVVVTTHPADGRPVVLC